MLRWILKITLGLIALLAAVLVMLAASIVEYGNHSEIVPADAAIVLGAAPWGDQPSPVFRERINHAITLYRAGWARKIIFTGGPDDARVAHDYALAQGVPEQAILWTTNSRTTAQDLYYASELAKQHGLGTFLVVSDPLHMKRAMAMAADLGMHAYAAPTPTTRYRSWFTQIPFALSESFNFAGYLVTRSFILAPSSGN
ncbi:MAG: YdcF family protein [Chloroflexi bacterium]|nr:YdcF family protein [Chloroflexota bacterium]